MDAIETAALLVRQQAVALSLARENDSYCIPVSFTFEEREQNAYRRLGYGPTSINNQFVEVADLASVFVATGTGE